ncbi:MAG: low molecular weight phosphatase family protein [Thermoplasmata archaeon]
MPLKTVLFICVGNSGRSLMAEAMFNANPPEGWTAISAGTSPAASANPRTGPILREIGLGLPPHPPQLLTPEMMETASVRVTMGCLDDAACPARLKTLELRDWALPDPVQLDDAGFRGVRDRLLGLVKGLRTEIVLSDRRRKAVAEATPARPT